MAGAAGKLSGAVPVLRTVVVSVTGAPAVTVPNARTPGVTVAAGAPTVSRELRFDVGEGRIADQLRGLAAEFPELAFGSYPFFSEGVYGTNIVVRGTDPHLVELGFARVRQLRDATPGAGGAAYR